MASRTAQHYLAAQLLCVGLTVSAGCMLWSGRISEPGPFVDDVPLQIDADFDLSNNETVLQEVRNLKMELRDDLGVPFSNRQIRVRIFRDPAMFQQFIQQRFPQLSGRRALFVVEKGQYQVYAAWSEEVLSDLRHELTHAYLNSTVGTLPLWLDEGLAEYYEVVGVRGRINREHLPWLTDGLEKSNWAPDIKRLASLTLPESMTHQDYAESWLWVHYMMQSDHPTLITDYFGERLSNQIPTPISLKIANQSSESNQAVIQHLQNL